MSIHKYVVGVLGACAVSVLCPLSVAAQSETLPSAQTRERVRAGLYLKGGVNLESLDVSVNGSFANGTSQGFIGGVAFAIPANRKVAFQMELLLNDGRPISAVPTDADRAVALIAIPVLLRVNVSNTATTRVGILGGVTDILQVQRKSSLETEAFEDTVFTVGMDIENRSGLLLDLRYSRGVLNPGSEPGVRLASRSRGFAAMVGWRLL
jgi:hypothetical protein